MEQSSEISPLNDGISLVQILDVMGSDLTVVNAARVSFGKQSNEMDEKDGRLIKYLAKHHHVTPFFHPQVQMRIRMPIWVAREWYRHQIGFARNEISRRYVDEAPSFYIPKTLRARDKNLKQGSKEVPPEMDAKACEIIHEATTAASEVYKVLLELDVAPELARIILPQSMYTEFIETGSLAAYARLCKLRLDPTAQKEIQLYADAVSSVLSKAFPVSWKALVEDGEAH
jgi:thymidylate synthase (FAD)